MKQSRVGKWWEWSKKEKGPVDMDSSVVIAGVGIRELNGNGKIQLKK